MMDDDLIGKRDYELNLPYCIDWQACIMIKDILPHTDPDLETLCQGHHIPCRQLLIIEELE